LEALYAEFTFKDKRHTRKPSAADTENYEIVKSALQRADKAEAEIADLKDALRVKHWRIEQDKALKERIELLEEMRDINGFITIHTDKTSQILLDENKALKAECERKVEILINALNKINKREMGTAGI
jgi:hypothetical protein